MAAVALKGGVKSLARRTLPLAWRQRCAIWLDRQRWLPSGRWWAAELIRDMADEDVDAYHRFLWKHHLGYADTYEVEQRFGPSRIHPTRRMLFEDLERVYAARGGDLGQDVRSVFEVGCSLGYLLRWTETDVLEHPETLEGVDIDERAVEQGRGYLAAQGSIVTLRAADMGRVGELLEGRVFDLFLCCGVLMYTREQQAAEIVRAMLDHGKIVAISGLAHPEKDNLHLEGSAVRERDGTFIHNIDRMVTEAGGRVLERRWEGPRSIDGNTIYSLICAGKLTEVAP